ncbi:MAG: glycosyltransferase family 4 protein [Armatimonadetes bacterium]|nr:glycosyltransferase family 4 protein [Armatimonadota bacterium]
MRIGLVCPYDYYRPGGVQSHIRHLAVELRKRGHSAKVLAPLCPGNAPEADVLFVGRARQARWGGTTWEVCAALGQERRGLNAILETERFELLHFHTIWNPILPFQILWASRTTRIATFHDTPTDDLLGRLLARVVMPLASYLIVKLWLQAAVAVSEVTRSYLVRLCRGAIHQIPNGVETQRYAREKNQPLAEYRDGKLNILFAGRLEGRKRVFDLVEAFERLKSRHPHLRLLIIGDGYQMPALKERVRRIEDVEILGAKTQSEMPRYYASCDIFCSPAAWGESCGIVLLEAMASGMPAVGAANAGYQTVLTGAGARMLFEPRNVLQLTHKLEELILDPALREELSAWGRAEVRKYDWTAVTDRIEALYYEAILRGNGTRS